MTLTTPLHLLFAFRNLPSLYFVKMAPFSQAIKLQAQPQQIVPMLLGFSKKRPRSSPFWVDLFDWRKPTPPSARLSFASTAKAAGSLPSSIFFFDPRSTCASSRVDLVPDAEQTRRRCPKVTVYYRWTTD